MTFSNFLDRVGGAAESGAGERIAPDLNMRGAAVVGSVGSVTVGVGDGEEIRGVRLWLRKTGESGRR
ncbi:hypothetical protein EON65_50295 [archaeon]|nr:MAG: hypothetical protein EON65_50295 [archaeon]